MIEALRSFGQSGAILLFGLATGAAWIMTIVVPNVSYDRLDASRADAYVRDMLKKGSSQIAVLLLCGAAMAVLGSAIGAAITGGLAALGFFTNQWTLASFKRGETPPGARRKRKTQRVVAVSLTLIFTLVALIAAVLAVFKV